MGSFIDNPVIAGLGDQLGMGSMFDAMRGVTPTVVPPVPGQSQNADVHPGHSAPNIPPYRNRPYIPRNESSGGGGTPGVNGAPPINPGSMDPATLQSPQVLSLLGQYGVKPSTTPPDPNLFIHNSQAFQKHPVLAGMLERGLDSLANTHPGQNFWQSFTGQLRGNREAEAERGAQVNAQLMAPLNQASAIQQLQQRYDEHLTSQDNVAYHQGMLKYYQDVAEDKRTHYLDTPPRMNAETGEMMALTPDESSPTGYKWAVDPTLGRDERKYQTHLYYTSAVKALADAKYNGDESQLTPMDHMKIISDMDRQNSLDKGAASTLNTTIKSKATVTAAGIRGASSGNSHMNPADKLQYQDLDNQDKSIQKEIDNISNAQRFYEDPDGHMLIVGSQAYKNYMKKLQTNQQQLRQQKQVILGRYQGQGTVNSTPSGKAPAFSSNNPFAHPQASTPQ